MRGRLRTRISIDTDENSMQADSKTLTPLELIEVGIRTALFNTKSAKKKRADKEAASLKAYNEKLENLKTVILDKLTEYMSSKENLLLRKHHKTALTCYLAVSRTCSDVLEELLTHQEFSGYVIKILETDPDILIADPSTPIVIEFTKALVGGDYNAR